MEPQPGSIYSRIDTAAGGRRLDECTSPGDPDKRERNLRDHGIDFADVPPVFDGPTLEFPDDAHSVAEQRTRAVGLLGGREIAVIYTDDLAGVRHLISARKATSNERRIFYQAVGGR